MHRIPAPKIVASKRRWIGALSWNGLPRMRATARAGAAVLLVAAAVAGCGPATQSPGASHGAGSSASQVLAVPVDTPTSATPSVSPAVAKPLAATKKVVAAPATVSSGGSAINSAGAILPNARRTPGAANAAVTQATIHRTICVSGWTSTIRPSSSYTTSLKRSQLTSGYAFHGDLSTSDYEEDHLISLELGGSPTAVANLWPEPYAPTLGARKKDAIENRLHSLVCSGALSLTTAQHAIASNWWTAYQKYVGSTVTTAPRPAPKPAPAPQPPAAPAGATAQCNDGTYSYSQHHQGTCSHHGGVAIWL